MKWNDTKKRSLGENVKARKVGFYHHLLKTLNRKSFHLEDIRMSSIFH